MDKNQALLATTRFIFTLVSEQAKVRIEPIYIYINSAWIRLHTKKARVFTGGVGLARVKTGLFRH